jgi:hypothetical protein
LEGAIIEQILLAHSRWVCIPIKILFMQRIIKLALHSNILLRLMESKLRGTLAMQGFRQKIMLLDLYSAGKYASKIISAGEIRNPNKPCVRLFQVRKHLFFGYYIRQYV